MNQVEFSCGPDSIAILRLHSGAAADGPANDFRIKFEDMVAEVAGHKEIIGVVVHLDDTEFLSSGGRAELLGAMHAEPDALYSGMARFKQSLRTLEMLSVPVVAAIEGNAIGGAFEIALACHQRISRSSAIYGFRDCAWGLIPGAGGIVRLTKLLGLRAALPILLGDKMVSAGEGLDAGIVDTVLPEDVDLLEAARSRLAGFDGDARQPWDRPGYVIPGGDANSAELAALLPFLPIEILRRFRGLEPAPGKVLIAATEAARLDINAALRIETRQWVSAMTSPVAHNMTYAIGALERSARADASRPKGVGPRLAKRVGIIGAGMMGGAIAHVCASAGMYVVLNDRTLELADRGKSYSANCMAREIEKGRIEREEADTALSRIQTTERWCDLAGCDLIVEAVYEDLKLKRDLVAQVQPLLPKGVIWGSNTSMLPITRLAHAGVNPENFIGIHFFSPVEKMRLVEVIRGERTSDETLAGALDFVRQLGKIPIVVNDSLGFFTSRVFSTQLIEGAKMLLEGIHPRRIDAMARAAGMPVGPLTISDEVSLKLIVDVRETQLAHGFNGRTSHDQPEAYALIKSLVEEDGRLGRAYGGGYYDYTNGERRVWEPIISRYYRQDVDITDRDLQDRILFRAVIETLLCLEEGVLNSAADANVGSLLGIGAPRHTGGYVQFVNGYGLKAFANRCAQLSSRYGERFACPEIVHKHISQGRAIH